MKIFIKALCVLLSIIVLIIPYASYNALEKRIDFEFKIDSVLLEKLNDMEESDKIEVSVWLTNIDKQEEEQEILVALNEKISKGELPAEVIGLFDFESEYGKYYSVKKDIKEIDNAVDTKAMQLAVSTKRKVSSEVYERTNNKKIRALFSEEQINNDIIFKSNYTPSVVITLSKSDVFRIAGSELVDNLYYYEAETIVQSDEELELTSSFGSDLSNNQDGNRSGLYNFSTFQYEMTGIEYMRDTLGYTGEGLNIGIIDFPFANSSTIDYFNQDTIPTWNYCEQTDGIIDAYTSHGNRVACLIAGNYNNSQTGDMFLGAVPDAHLYITAGIDFRSALESLLSENVCVINMSLSIEGDYAGSGMNTYTELSKFIDHIVSQHNVNFVSAAGNEGYIGIVNGSFTYNSISVGNCNSTGERFGGTSGASSYCNLYDTLIKPDLMAPGTGLVIPAGRDNNSDVPIEILGTSYAAPIVTGAVAQLCQMSSSLATNPRLMKSILLSGSTINGYMNLSDMIVTDNTLLDNKFSKQYGSGILNVKNAYDSYTTNYIAHGYIPYFSGSISSSKNVTVTSGSLIRISAVWDKMNTFDHNANPYYIPDVNYESYLLYITSPNNTVYKALYYYDTKLMTSFIASQGGTYNIQLVRMSNSYNNFTSYGLSLSVQGNPLS